MLYFQLEKEILGFTKGQIPSNRETQSLLGPDEMSGWPGCRKDHNDLKTQRLVPLGFLLVPLEISRA